MGAKMYLVHTQAPDNYTTQQIGYSSEGQQTVGTTHTTDENYNVKLDLYADFNWKNNQSASVNFTNIYNKNTYSRQYEESDFRTFNDVDEDFYNGNLQLDYVWNLNNKHTLSLSFMDNYRVSNALYANEGEKAQRLYTNESILHAGFFYLINKQWTFNTRAGLSFLDYQQKGEKHVSRFSPRVNAALSYTPAKQHALNLQFNMGNSFPTINYLNNVTQAVNAYQVQKGNPALKIY